MTDFRADIMYTVAPWDRRRVARAGGPQFASRDSAKARVRKAQAATARRRADRAVALAELLEA